MDGPRPFEANPGLIAFHSRTAVDRLEVRVNGRRYRTLTLPQPTRRSTVGPIGLPSRDLTITVIAYHHGARIGTQTATNVLRLPRASMAVHRATTTSTRAQQRMRRIARPATTAAAWAVNLSSGRGASYNAGARFTAASTVKLPILIAILINRRADVVHSDIWGTLQSMIRESSNDAANDALLTLAGSLPAGGARATWVAHRLGATHTNVASGYLPGQDRSGPNPPVLVNDQPDVPCCKQTTAHDLGVLMQSIVEAAAGHGKARQLGLTGRDARVALWLLAHTDDRGLFKPWTRFVTAHKIGFVDRAWHDVAVVFTHDGPLVVVAMTDNPGGASKSAAAEYGRGILGVATRDLGLPSVVGPAR